MKRYRLCFLGFGNVGRALARLLVAKSTDLRERYDIEWEITGIATRRLGWRASGEAIDIGATEQIPTQNGLGEDLQSHRTVEDGVVSFVNLAHSAGAQLGENRVMRDPIRVHEYMPEWRWLTCPWVRRWTLMIHRNF